MQVWGDRGQQAHNPITRHFEENRMEALDTVFELLGKERRRYALYYLEQQDEPVSIEELATVLEDWEDNGTGPAPDQYEDIMVSLKHHHLPKAADAQYIEYDPAADEIQITGEPAEFRVILSVAEAIEQPAKDDIIHLV